MRLITNKALIIVYAACAMFSVSAKPTVGNVTAKQRYPWNGKVNISYTLTGDVSADVQDGDIVVLSVTANDIENGTNYVALASALSGNIGTEEGFHHVVWDLNAQGLEFKSDDVVFTVTYEATPPLYCVINLSAGANATSYPVSYLADVPSGGWTDEYKTTKLVLRRIEPGSIPTRDAAITKPFYIGVFEVTQRQYELVMESRPSYFNNDSCYTTRPVEKVSYDMIRGSSAGAGWPASFAVDGDSFMGRLRSKTSIDGFDLPTEAQWVYACRAGTTTDYNSGKDHASTLQDSAMDEVGRYKYNGGQDDSQDCATWAGTAKVGTYKPNIWGLYDMHGNVQEWCLDWSDGAMSGDDPVGSSSGTRRILRGGCWDNVACNCTSSDVSYSRPSNCSLYNGFRITRILSNGAFGGTICTGDSSSAHVDLRAAPTVDTVNILWDASWIGGNESATVVIEDNGVEIARKTGVGEFEYALTGIGRHDLAYKTLIDGVEQEEVYTATIFKDWKYEIDNDGGAIIIDTVYKTGYINPGDL